MDKARLMTVAEASKYLTVSKATLYRWIETADVPHVRLPSGRLRFQAKELDAWLKGRSRQGGAAS